MTPVPSPEIMQLKGFHEKWIQMTNDRREGFEEIVRQYQNLIQEFEERYLQMAHNSLTLSSIDEFSQNNPRLRYLFELAMELKQTLQPLQDQLKTDKRFLFTPVFRLPDEISNHINTFLTIYHIFSLLPNSIVLVFSEANEYQSSYSCILSFDKLQKIIKVFASNQAIFNSWTILLDVKIFLESLYAKSQQWAQDSKKLMPIGTRAGIKKAAVLYTVKDLEKILEDPVTRYVEPPGYHELVEVSNNFQECERDILAILISQVNEDEECEDTQFISYLDSCRLIERWNNLCDRIHQLPVQFDKYSTLLKWLSELFEWIRAVPEQVFDLLQIPDLNTNHFNVTNNSKKLNFIEKDRSNVLIDIGNSFLTQSNHETLSELFKDLHAIDTVPNETSPFFHFTDNVNSIIRFTLKIHEYFCKCFDETLQYEVLAKGILQKISSTTTAENLDKNIEILKKLLARCDELFILPDGLLRINIKNLLRQLETSLWDGITLFNENNKKNELDTSLEMLADTEQWIPSNLKKPQGTSEELLTTATSYFEDEDEEYIDEALLGDDDDEFLPSPTKKRKRSKSNRNEPSSQKPSGKKSSISDFVDIHDSDDEESLQNCIIDSCEWPRMSNSSYCSESCAIQGYAHLLDALLNYKPIACHQIISQGSDDKNSKLEQVVQALDQGNTTPESLVHECKVFGVRTTDIMLHSLSQVSIDFLFPPLSAVSAALSNNLRKQVRTELQHAILSSLTRLKIPCAFGCAVIIATDIEKAMSLNVTSDDAVRSYRKKYLLLSKALKDPYNDTKIHKILLNEMSVDEFLKLDSTEFDDDEKQQRRLESINAEKKKLVPAGKSLTELLEEKRRAAEEGAEAWRDGTAMDQSTAIKPAPSALPSKLTTPLPTPLSIPPKKPQKEIKVDPKPKEPEIKSESRTESPRSHPSPKPSPKQIAPPITSLLQMDTNKRPKVEKIEPQPVSHILTQALELKTPTPASNSSTFEYFTDVRVSTPLGPASAHVPQLHNPEDGPLKVLLTNQNDSEFVIHITNYPVMRETVSLVCTGGICDSTGQGLIISGIQNDKRYQVDALRKQLRNFRKHIHISILVLSVKEDRELTEGKYRYICNMFADPQKERIPSVEIPGVNEQTYNLHIVVPQLTHYFPQLNPIIQKSTAILPHGFWLYGILEMDRDAQGPESLVRCNQLDFPLENIKFLMGKVDKLVNTIESMPQPDVKLAIERVQQTVGDQFDFLNPGHKDFQFFINQVNQRLREKKLQEWSQDNDKKRKLEGKTDRSTDRLRSDSRHDVSEKSKHHRQDNGSSRSSHPRENAPSHSDSLIRDPPGISRRSSYEEQPKHREPQLARSRSDEHTSDSRNGGHHGNDRTHDWNNSVQRKSRFS